METNTDSVITALRERDEARAAAADYHRLLNESHTACEKWMDSERKAREKLDAVIRERDEALNIIGQTRAASTYAMDEIRAALGVPSGAEDKTSNRAVDYVRRQTDQLNHLRANEKTTGTWYDEAVQEIAQLRAEIAAARVNADFWLAHEKQVNCEFEQDYLAIWRAVKQADLTVLESVLRLKDDLAAARDALSDLDHCVDELCGGDEYADAVVGSRNTQSHHQAAITAAHKKADVANGPLINPKP